MSETNDNGDGMASGLQPITHDEYLSSTFAVAKNNYTLGDIDLARACPLDNWSPRQEPQRDLGMLDKLPLELQQAIFNQIDLQTLIGFRRVNLRALQIVDSVPEYRNIIKHFPDALRAVLSIESASHITCLDLWSALTTRNCSECGDFGGFIYLLTCRRVCFTCNRDTNEYFPLTLSEASRLYGLTQSMPSTVSKMRSIPGAYSYADRLCRGRMTLVDREAAREAGMAQHGSEQAMLDFVNYKQLKVWDRYQKRKEKNAVDGVNARIRRPNYLAPRDRGEENERRFMAIIRAPVIKKVTMTVEQGRHCMGCRNRPQWRREYSKESFAEHLKAAGSIEQDWQGVKRHVSQE